MKVRMTVEIEIDQTLIEDGGPLGGFDLQNAVRELYDCVHGSDDAVSVRVISRETLPGDVEPQSEWWDHASHAYPVATCHLCQQHK